MKPIGSQPQIVRLSLNPANEGGEYMYRCLCTAIPKVDSINSVNAKELGLWFLFFSRYDFGLIYFWGF